MGHVVYAVMPQDGHWLASFEVIPPHTQEVSFSAAKKSGKFPAENGMRTPTFEKKSQTQNFLFLLFRRFCRKFCHVDVDSREQ